MTHTLPQLPYTRDALAPLITGETMDYHYGKHHKAYVDKLNELLPGTPFEKMELIEIVKKAKGPLFNNAAQHWNHSFYWQSMVPGKHEGPKGVLSDAITKDFGSMGEFEKKFTAAAVGEFGSGWVWLTRNKSGKLMIETTPDAENPIHKDSGMPLFTCDVWEHAYYIDYRNARAKYVESFMKLLNWHFVETNFAIHDMAHLMRSMASVK